MLLRMVISSTFALLLFAMNATVSRAQSCAACVLEVTPLRVIGENAGPVRINHFETRAAASSDGRLVLKSNYPRTLVIVDSTGRLLRVLGDSSTDNGTLGLVGAAVWGTADSLFVFDWQRSRYLLFAPDMRLIRTVRLPVQPALTTIVLSTGHFVFNTPIRTQQSIGQPLHLVSREGELIRSFGSESGLFRPDVPFLERRAIVDAGDGRVWSAYRSAYRVELWNAKTGTLERTIVRDVDWFPSRLHPNGAAASDPSVPIPLLLNMRYDRDRELLTVLLQVPAANWKRARQIRTNSGGYGGPDEQQQYDTIVEVLDSRTGRMLSSKRLSDYIRFFVDESILGTVVLDDRDVPRLRLWRVEFNRQ